MHCTEIIERGRLFFDAVSKKGDRLDALIESFEYFVAKVRPERRKIGLRTEERLCRYCVVLAYLDCIGRAPFGNSAIEVLSSVVCRNPEQSLRRVDHVLTADVVALSEKFYESHAPAISKARKVVIGGTLVGSADIGGADFDLLVNGCLFDLKATRQPRITTQQLRQMVGYWLLDYDDALKIRSIAISLLRHGHTEYFDIEKDLRPSGPGPTLRLNFRKELARAASAAP